MKIPDLDNPLGLSVTALSRVDRICAEFEEAWQRGTRPDLAGYLGRGGDEIKPALLAELVALDVDYRQRLGEQPTREDYLQYARSEEAILETVFSRSGLRETEGGVLRRQPAPDVPGHFGRYRVIEQIGCGSFGTVYRGHDDELDRDVAIKVPHRHLMHAKSAVEVFRREARALATVRHPGIVPVYDVHFEDDDPTQCFVVSQFMPGGNLADVCAGDRPDAAEAARIVEGLARALHHAHQRGLVHRDVKLLNILIDAEGRPQLADFGLVLLDAEVGLADAGSFVGTPASMSPEQARGDAHLVDGRSDVYGLGVVLYELLTGKRPFAENNLPALLNSIQFRDPKPPRQVDDEIPRELERICLKALAKQPQQRYATAVDMANDLSRFLRRRAGHLWTRTRILAATLVGIAAMSGWWALPTRPPLSTQPIRTLAILPFQPMTDETTAGDLQLLGIGMADTLTTKLANAKQLIVRSGASLDPNERGDADPVALGHRLRADAVLTGSLQQIGGRMRAHVQLIQVEDGQLIWADTFDEPSSSLFAVQDAVSSRVLQSLALQISPAEQRRIKLRYTNSREAYEAYVKGRHAWQQRARRNQNDLKKAIEYFRAAIDADPLFARAYIGLAESYALTNIYMAADPQAFPRARAAAQRAIELDPDLTEAHAVLALVTHCYDWDFKAAEAGFKRAIALNPNNATARQWYAELLYFSRRFDEGIAQLRKAAELDPLSPVIADLQGVPYMYRGDYGRAMHEFERARRQNPESLLVMHCLGIVAMQQGRLEEALEYHRRQGSPYQQAFLLAKMGETDEARDLWQQSKEHLSPYQEAVVHVGLGEFDDAFKLLDRAVENREERLVWILVDPKLDPIREDPRFLKLLRRVGRLDP